MLLLERTYGNVQAKISGKNKKRSRSCSTPILLITTESVAAWSERTPTQKNPEHLREGLNEALVFLHFPSLITVLRRPLAGPPMWVRCSESRSCWHLDWVPSLQSDLKQTTGCSHLAGPCTTAQNSLHCTPWVRPSGDGSEAPTSATSVVTWTLVPGHVRGNPAFHSRALQREENLGRVLTEENATGFRGGGITERG